MTPAPTDSHAIAPRTLTVLAYLGGWTTGMLVWLIERDDVGTRFHAAQSMLLFGGLSVLWLGFWGGSFLVLTVSATGFTAFQRLSQAVLVLMLGLWAVALWRAWSDRPWRVPIVARPAERAARWRLRA